MGNPFRQKLKLAIGTAINENVSVFLTDASGRIMIKQDHALVTGENAIELDGSLRLAPGTYMLKIYSSRQTKTYKIIKVQ
jgi:hypothetical protein